MTIIMLINHHRVILATVTALVLLVAAVNADPDGISVRRHKQQQQQQQHYRGGVRGAKNKQQQSASVLATNRNLKRGMMGRDMSDKSKNRRMMGPRSDKGKSRKYKDTDKRKSKSKKKTTELKPALIGSFVSDTGTNNGFGGGTIFKYDDTVVFGRFDPAGYDDNSVAVTAAAVAAQQEAKEVQALPSAGYDVWTPTIADDTVIFGIFDPAGYNDNSVAPPSKATNVFAPRIDSGRIFERVDIETDAATTALADEFDDDNNSTTIIIDTNSTQEEDDDGDELGFVDDDAPIDDSNSTSTTTVIDDFSWLEVVSAGVGVGVGVDASATTTTAMATILLVLVLALQ